MHRNNRTEKGAEQVAHVGSHEIEERQNVEEPVSEAYLRRVTGEEDLGGVRNLVLTVDTNEIQVKLLGSRRSLVRSCKSDLYISAICALVVMRRLGYLDEASPEGAVRTHLKLEWLEYVRSLAVRRGKRLSAPREQRGGVHEFAGHKMIEYKIRGGSQCPDVAWYVVCH